MKEKASENLATALSRLSLLTEQIYKTQGYSREAEKINLLRELVREQIQPETENNENISNSISAIR
jgi:hypothetical protein